MKETNLQIQSVSVKISLLIQVPKTKKGHFVRKKTTYKPDLAVKCD